MGSAFADCHPAVNFLWTALILVGAMVLHHPVSLTIALVCSLLWAVSRGGKRSARFALRAMLPLLLLTTALNPLFSHEGATILWYFPSGNPLTLESIFYGISAGVVLITVIFWFSGLTKVLTGDKFMVLFGKTIPALSLVLSMSMGMVPRFRRRLRQVTQGQKAIGRDPAEGTLVQRGRKGITVLSILVTWALEDAIHTADSMKSRGYGLPGRTAYDPCPMTGRDKDLLLLLGSLGVVLTGLWLKGSFYFQIYPIVYGVGWDIWTVTGQLCYLALCAFPLAVDGWERHLRKEGSAHVQCGTDR